MTTEPSKKPWRSHFNNWLSLGGLVVSAGGFFAFLLLFAIDLSGRHGNPYMGILAYVIAPGFFLLGLAMAITGAVLHRRHMLKAAPRSITRVLVIDLSRPRDRRLLVAFVAGALGFLLLTAIGSNRAYHHTESVQFCGQTCHEPMKPEYTAYLTSPHARVACVECHVGAGARAYVHSKLNGVRQLYCTIVGDISRPIKTPVDLRPAQETCEQCHWPSRYAGDLDRTYHHFLADETNTPFSVRMILKVGGGDPAAGPVGGIHWHMNIANKVHYIATDEQRQVIPWVRLTDAEGNVTEYRTPDFKDDPNKYQIRTMDCMDCHSRPAHQFQSPNWAVDLAMATGKINPALPWVKSNAVAALTQEYSTESEALQKIATSLRAKYGGSPEVDGLIAEVQALFQRNFFPEMKTDWRAYRDNLNHKDSAGCFRCHDGLHKTADGKKTIKASDCNSCHTILAQGSGEQLNQLNPKGHTFFHIDAPNEDFSCNNCHTGAFPKE